MKSLRYIGPTSICSIIRIFCGVHFLYMGIGMTITKPIKRFLYSTIVWMDTFLNCLILWNNIHQQNCSKADAEENKYKQ